MLAEPLLRERTILGEGAYWDSENRKLLWLDILGQRCFAYDPTSGINTVYAVPQMVGTIVRAESGDAIVALQDGFARLDLQSGAVNWLKKVEDDRPETRFNDGKCDPAGRLWAGTMSTRGVQGAGTLYCLEHDLTVEPKLNDVSCSNGIVWSSDARTMYYVDSPRFTIDAFDYDLETGRIGNRRVSVSVPRERCVPDGIWLDEAGSIWSAHFGSGKVTCWDPRKGIEIRSIEVPGAKRVTSVAFGGPHRKTMYITTASVGLDDAALKEQPNAGFLFVIDVDIPGVTAFRFRG